MIQVPRPASQTTFGAIPGKSKEDYDLHHLIQSQEKMFQLELSIQQGSIASLYQSLFFTHKDINGISPTGVQLIFELISRLFKRVMNNPKVSIETVTLTNILVFLNLQKEKKTRQSKEPKAEISPLKPYKDSQCFDLFNQKVILRLTLLSLQVQTGENEKGVAEMLQMTIMKPEQLKLVLLSLNLLSSLYAHRDLHQFLIRIEESVTALPAFFGSVFLKTCFFALASQPACSEFLQELPRIFTNLEIIQKGLKVTHLMEFISEGFSQIASKKEKMKTFLKVLLEMKRIKKAPDFVQLEGSITGMGIKYLEGNQNVQEVAQMIETVSGEGKHALWCFYMKDLSRFDSLVRLLKTGKAQNLKESIEKNTPESFIHSPYWMDFGKRIYSETQKLIFSEEMRKAANEIVSEIGREQEAEAFFKSMEDIKELCVLLWKSFSQCNGKQVEPFIHLHTILGLLRFQIMVSIKWNRSNALKTSFLKEVVQVIEDFGISQSENEDRSKMFDVLNCDLQQ